MNSMTQQLDRLVLHPRVTGSLLFRPRDLVSYYPGNTEAVRVDEGTRFPEDSYTTVLDFLLQYDYRGSNPFQEQENLAWLALYFGRYPEVVRHFRADILVPQTRIGDAL